MAAPDTTTAIHMARSMNTGTTMGMTTPTRRLARRTPRRSMFTARVAPMISSPIMATDIRSTDTESSAQRSLPSSLDTPC
jgi:hypothetical protein